jgi:hypothetical protein
MKESRKKKAKRRPVLNAKKLGKREGRLVRKVTGDPKYRARLFDALAATLSEDRSSYFDSFLSAWEQAAASLNAATDAIITSPEARIDDAQIERFGMAWDPVAVRIFMRLADRLTEQEERVLRIRRDRLAVAWSSFAAALAMRRPDLRETIDGLQDAAARLGAHVADIFLGELPPQLGDGYTALMRDYGARIEAIRKGGRGQ